MPAKNPRLTLTIPSELDASIAELAKLREVSKASVAVEFLQSAQPIIERVVKVMRALKSAEQSTVNDYVSSLEDAEKTLAPLLAAALGRLEVPGSVEPPSCNTGVTPPSQSPNNTDDHNNGGVS